jgi:hypothetical protein
VHSLQNHGLRRSVPVDCFYEGENMLVIHPDECIDCGVFASRHHRRGPLAAQIPIAEPAARPTERTSRDFVPWRFSDAGRQSAWLGRGCRRPKTCTEPDVPIATRY